MTAAPQSFQQISAEARAALLNAKALLRDTKPYVPIGIGILSDFTRAIKQIDAVLRASDTPEEITSAEMDTIEAAAIAGKPLNVSASGDVRAAVIEECAKVAEQRLGGYLCPYGRDVPGDPTWEHRDSDECPVCGGDGEKSLHKCHDTVSGRIAAQIRALSQSPATDAAGEEEIAAAAQSLFRIIEVRGGSRDDFSVGIGSDRLHLYARCAEGQWRLPKPSKVSGYLVEWHWGIGQIVAAGASHD